MKPVHRDAESVTFNVGQTIWGQQVKLVRERHDGKVHWRIDILGVSQRDEGGRVHGLTSQTLAAVASIVAEFEKP